MANVVRDPREHPDAVLPDFSKPDPLVTFKLEDVAFVYGSKWKQRYFKKVGTDYFPLPAQWDVTHRMWRPYTIADINVRSHTFAFIKPELTDQFKMPNPCTGCHTDRSTDWARSALKEWPGVSPWRAN